MHQVTHISMNGAYICDMALITHYWRGTDVALQYKVVSNDDAE
jgi:hypothetical protein